MIVAVPFISIAEQLADVYRRVFEQAGDAAPMVLEHHSGAVHAVDPDDADDADGEYGGAREWARLAAEIWDAPVVVNTTVRLFESLFATRPSAMRRLHRLAGSVIILDEAQAIPALRCLEPRAVAYRFVTQWPEPSCCNTRGSGSLE